jgi:N-ethylmaleimide reductase
MTDTLFSKLFLGNADLPNRIVMAPMTRSRATQPGDVPNAMMAQYYAQRASAGLIITEATQISPQGKGYSFTPGIFSPEQVAGWKLVTDAVHAAGGRIFLQLWHVGRMSHSSFHVDGMPVAPSALSPDAQVWVVDPATGIGGMVDCPVPRALEINEIANVIEDFRKGAANAIAAGFDGVEIHGANGYLIDQFLRRSSNHRDDKYGGTQDNRIRFLAEVAQAVADEVGGKRTGIRLAPYITQRNMADDEIIPTILKAAKELSCIGLAYIHLSEADWEDAPVVPDTFRQDLRAAFSGKIIVAGKYTFEQGQAIIASGFADLVAYGRPFIGNPDLPHRFAKGLPLAGFDMASAFGGTQKGLYRLSSFGSGIMSAPPNRIGTHLVLDTQVMKVWHIRLMPGDVLPPHRHDHPYLWTVLTDGKGRASYGDGRVAEVDYKAGDTQYFAELSADHSFTYDLANIGETELLFATIEFPLGTPSRFEDKGEKS